jgi:hypothetical protein
MILHEEEWRVIFEDIFDRTWFDPKEMTLSDMVLLKLMAMEDLGFVKEEEPEVKEFLNRFKGFNVLKYYLLPSFEPEERIKYSIKEEEKVCR